MLLAGATGFIGRHIQRRLLDDGQAVRALVRPGSLNRHHADPRCDIVEAGLDDVPSLARVVRDCRAVIYAAGQVRGRSLEDFLPANVDGVGNLLRAMRGQEWTPPFLLISSLAAGRPELSAYARSKSLGEDALSEHATGPWTVLRPPAVYGPGDREMRPILRMARSGWIPHPGPADQRVSLLYADDLARAVLAWLEDGTGLHGGVYAIDDGTPGGYDWHAIAAAAGHDRPRLIRVPRVVLDLVARTNQALAGLFRYAPMLTPGKVRELTEPDWLCDNTAFTAATGWRPRIDLARGLRLTLQATGD